MYVIIGSVAVALIFDVINGFHDAANSIATVVSTRVLSPRVAVLWAAFFNFVAMFVFAPRVADTIAKIVRIDGHDSVYVYVVLSGLLGAIFWDLITWWLGLPTSSSHALIGGVAGAGLAYQGMAVIRWDNIWKTVKFIPLAPLIGLVVGFTVMLAIFWLFRRWRPSDVDRLFRKGQLFSAALYSLGHGGNDAQKTMGIIMALLIAGGLMDPGTQLSLLHLNTMWIILSCHLAMALGTAFGGWRIVKTMGMKITKLKPVGGFCAETAGAATLFMATHMGVPVSTTHTITGAIVGVGATSKLSGIKWGVAGRIIWAWIITIPASGLIATGCFYFIKLFHPGF
ncbi:MAG: inorganic phosphate transporter [candidate division Zixibacteria bacterium]|nr:inorganic phosphate transporter [candidate division Zixibacteria bacterium]MDD5426409.1 inorganic phosphate transporter [candidate division Zixibacteria bacterium]